MEISGLEKSSLLDYPGKISAVIFTYGCNLRCPYCHNPELVVEPFNEDREITEKYLMEFLKHRVGKLDAVVITGGEPLIQNDLLPLVEGIKEMGYLIKLDTNGFLPDKLKRIIKTGYIDYIAMDVKYPRSEYIKQTGKSIAQEKISTSIDIIMNSGIDYEFRTTYVRKFHDLESVEKIGQMIEGAERYYIQNFRAGKTIDPFLSEDNSFSQKELKEMKKVMKKYVKKAYIR